MQRVENSLKPGFDRAGHMAKNAMHLVRPQHGVVDDVPLPAAQVRKLLRLGQPLGGLLQRIDRPLALGDVAKAHHGPYQMVLFVANGGTGVVRRERMLPSLRQNTSPLTWRWAPS